MAMPGPVSQIGIRGVHPADQLQAPIAKRLRQGQAHTDGMAQPGIDLEVEIIEMPDFRLFPAELEAQPAIADRHRIAEHLLQGRRPRPPGQVQSRDHKTSVGHLLERDLWSDHIEARGPRGGAV